METRINKHIEKHIPLINFIQEFKRETTHGYMYTGIERFY